MTKEFSSLAQLFFAMTKKMTTTPLFLLLP